MITSVIIFPGSNCDRDVIHAISENTGTKVESVWHKERLLPEGTGLVVLPGGFSYGDYLRCGALSARSPIIDAVKEHALNEGLVLGICNGFQVLLETGLLPGAVLTNRTLTFICKKCNLRVERNDTPFTTGYKKEQVVQFPIAHNDGLYFLPPEKLENLEKNGQVVFRYCSESGKTGQEFNPNGALNNIAGITSRSGNVLGLMPHPERASEEILGGKDGVIMWRSIQRWIERKQI